MINVKLDEDTALNLLTDRVRAWRSGEVAELFDKMYENYIDSGVFEGAEFDPMVIVDNDVVNYCHVIEEGDSDFEKIKNLYKENGGLCDISCESNYSYIEAVNDDEDPTLFLVRC